MNNYVTGSTIKLLREKKGYTQRQLAEKLMVSDKAVSKWESGRGVITSYSIHYTKLYDARFPQAGGLFAEPLRRKRAFAHAGGVSLYHADHAVDLCARHTRADGRIGGKRRGAGGVGEDAEVDIAERAKLCLKEDSYNFV